MTQAIFAIPGDKDRRTGGFLYEAAVLRALNEIGFPTAHLELPDGFPNPSDSDLTVAMAKLTAVNPAVPVILDGFVSGGFDPNLLATIPAPLVAMVHHPLGLETGLTGPQAAEFLALEAANLARVDHVMVPSPHTARTLVERLAVAPDRITVAPPGFPSDLISRRPQTPPLILSVGLLAPRKGHDVLLRALSRITDLDWRAEIVGKSHDREHSAGLCALVKCLDLTDRVTFRGELSQADLRNAYERATLFALATYYEGYGLVFGEAMRAGLPIVSTTGGAVPDTVGQGGLLVPPGDVAAFAEALRRMLTDDALHAEKLAAVNLAAKRLPDWHDTARCFVPILKKLASQAR